MPEAYSFVGCPCAGSRNLAGDPPKTLGLPVDEHMQPVMGAFFAMAVCQQEGNSPTRIPFNFVDRRSVA
jgi:hypothetical protein